MDEVKNALGLNEDSQENKTFNEESKQPKTSSSLGDNAAELVLAFFSYAVLILGLLGAVIVGFVVGNDNTALGWGCFFGTGFSVIITWAVCMVVVNISNNIRQIKKHLQGKS